MADAEIKWTKLSHRQVVRAYDQLMRVGNFAAISKMTPAERRVASLSRTLCSTLDYLDERESQRVVRSVMVKYADLPRHVQLMLSIGDAEDLSGKRYLAQLNSQDECIRYICQTR